MNTAIILSAGSSERSGLKFNKNLFVFDGKTVIEHTIAPFLKVKSIGEIIVAVKKAEIAKFEKLILPLSKKIKLCVGGDTRTQSVKNALCLATGKYVFIHDGARPFVSEKLIKKCAYMAVNKGNCVPTTPLTETVGELDNGQILRTRRKDLLSLQTPQVFETEKIKYAYSKISENDVFTDDCGVYCKYVGPCNFIEGEKQNIKLTQKQDFLNLLPPKTGLGFDIHTLVSGRKLILGGVTIPHTKGLLGHSDADCLLHALMDAMLSSCGLKDIGHYYPDTDPNYKDISSVILLKNTLKLVKKQGYKPVNATFTIMAEKPKLSPFVDEIKNNLAKLLDVKVENIGISCTTFEGVGDIGEERAIAVNCVCTLCACI